MAYTQRQMYDALVQLAIINKLTWWPWERAFGPANRAPAFWKELHKYCWFVYQKANLSVGDAVIGRMEDLVGVKRKVCNIDVKQSQTLFDEATKGNALEMDKWAPMLNDAWLLGGVHRFTDFVLHSPRAFQNLWEQSAYRTGLVVTARELCGLVAFGYERDTARGGEVRYVCRNRQKAQAADLLAYDRLARDMEAQGSGSILKFMGIRDDLAAEIRGFDPGKLRHVPAGGRA